MTDGAFAGLEMPDELLESIAGGALGDDVQAVLQRALPLLKKKGTSKDRAMGIFAKTADPQLREDTLAYIDEVWDTL